jgi:hypothetical protein
MMRRMFEDGVDALIARFSPHAAEVQLTARVEGSPLLECLADGVVLQVFERTGPYLVGLGRARVIVQPETATLTLLEEDDPAPERSVEVTAVSAIAVCGVIRLRDDPFVVVDAGLPLVVAVDELPDRAQAGQRVRFQSRSPLHGFVLAPEGRRPSIPTDDLV